MKSSPISVLMGVISGSIFLLGIAPPATACPMCLGGKTLGISAQELVYAQHSVLAMPNPDGTRFDIVAVIKGDPDTKEITEQVFRADPDALRGSPKPFLFIRDNDWPNWVNFGAIAASQASWLKQLSTGKRSTGMTPAEWCAHLAGLPILLDSPEPMVAGIAAAELENAPYPALRLLKPELSPAAIRARLADPTRSDRRALDILLLGIAGGPDDVTWIETQIDAAWQSNDATNLGSLIAADLELRGPARLNFTIAHYLADPNRSEAEIEAVILALGQQGQANTVIPRERVIEAYRILLKNHPEHAGLIAPDLATWQCWDFQPEFSKLTDPASSHCSDEHEAILDFLRRSKEAAKP